MKHLFIINPMAGKGNSLKLIPKIEEIFCDLKQEYKIEITQRPGHAIELVRAYVQQEDYRVYAVGGDGTLNEVLNGMVGSNSSLGVIPAGSGNDYIKSITKHPALDILQRTIIGKERLIDIGRINDRYFLNVASSGIDAKIAFNAQRLKKLPIINGFTAYLLSIIYTIFKYKSQFVITEIDDYKFKEITLLVAFGKGSSYGGGMKVLPNTIIDDGYLDVCYVKGMNKFKILTLFPTLIKGTHGAFTEYVSFFKCKRAKVSSEVEMPINIDGEIIMSKEVNFSILPKKIKFIVP
ncbi:MAG: diacylglycerol kinase family lipid kinase [Clostridiaceae bacterium]|nr:diacylglycerol kinase family lipid kinase [Clostridiaceae bacterium]